jgi:hypothetical protein
MLAALPFLPVLLAAAPAAAQQAAIPRLSPAAAAALLADPATQRTAALALAGLAGIVLDTRLGPLAALVDPADRARPSDTLHDVARRRDPDFDRHLYEHGQAAVADAGAVAAEAAELKRTADRLHAALAPLLAAAAPRGG